MRLQFLNRTREISKLTRALNSAEPTFIVVYGRRRCGKSTLLQCIARENNIYLPGRPTRSATTDKNPCE